MSPSCPYHCVAVDATTMLCASIILPITPPELLAAAISTGERPRGSADTFCRLRDSTTAEQRAEELGEPAGVGERESQRGVEPRPLGRVAEREHGRDRQERV